jgi:hypothetical protein
MLKIHCGTCVNPSSRWMIVSKVTVIFFHVAESRNSLLQKYERPDNRLKVQQPQHWASDWFDISRAAETSNIIFCSVVWTRFWWESLKEREQSEDQGVGGRMGSECILGRLDWLRIGTGVELLWLRWWTFGFLRYGVSFLFIVYRSCIIC